MTISVTTRKVQYTADGVQVEFPFSFSVLDASHMVVIVDDVVADPGEYTVTIEVDRTGDVTFNTAPADQAIVTLVRSVPLTQLTDYVPYDSFPAETHERALDKLTMIVQELQEAVDRTAQLPITTPEGTGTQLPPPEDDKVMVGKADLSGWENKPYLVPEGGATGPKNNYTAVIDPTGSDDVNQGYTVGSQWVNATGERAWVLIKEGLEGFPGLALWRRSDAVGLANVITVGTTTPLTIAEDGTNGNFYRGDTDAAGGDVTINLPNYGDDYVPNWSCRIEMAGSADSVIVNSGPGGGTLEDTMTTQGQVIEYIRDYTDLEWVKIVTGGP